MANPRSDKDSSVDKFVWPLIGIVVNLPTGEVGYGQSYLWDELLRRGFNSTCIHYLWNPSVFTALVEFQGLNKAMLFERAYEEDHHGKKDWYKKSDKKSGLYAWIARADDYNSNNVVGEYLRNIGVLKHAPEIMEDDVKKWDEHVSEITNVIEEKNKHLKETASKFSDGITSLGNLKEEKQNLLGSNYHEDIKRIQLSAQGSSQKRFSDQGKVKSEFESKRMKLNVSKTELSEKKMIAQELKKMDAMFKAKLGEVEKLEVLNQALITKERESANELQEARMQLMKALVKGKSSDAVIGVKNTMGKFDSKAFFEAIKRRPFYLQMKYSVFSGMIYNIINEYNQEYQIYEERVEESVKELFSLCGYFAADWHPFRVITVNDEQKEVIDHGDKKLIALKEEFGFEVYNKVTRALTEMNDQGDRRIAPELWNFKEGRKATLKEGVECLMKQCNKRNA